MVCDKCKCVEMTRVRVEGDKHFFRCRKCGSEKVVCTDDMKSMVKNV